MTKKLDQNSKVLFFGKKKDKFSIEAFKFLKKKFPKSKKILTDNKIGEKIKINYQKFDSIIIFKTKIIFTKNQLKKVKGLKINFHTSLPKYPGSNGVNYLIYNCYHLLDLLNSPHKQYGYCKIYNLLHHNRVKSSRNILHEPKLHKVF